MKKVIVFSIGLFLTHITFANNLKITNVVLENVDWDSDQARIIATFTVSWDNAWKNEKNHDAIWLFFKIENENDTRSWRHLNIKPDSFQFVHNYLSETPDASFWVPSDNKGVFVFPSEKHRGNISWRIKVALTVDKATGIDLNKNLYAKIHGIEMVYVPEGSFYLGDKDVSTQENSAAFHTFGSRKLYKVDSENEIHIGPKEGYLYFNNNGDDTYRGSPSGNIPKDFPKGYKSFYCMKYEVSEQNYVDFLNSIGNYYSSSRANFGNINYTQQRGGIFLEGNTYACHFPNRPATYLSFEDQSAFADWAALRPMTELEYEKACRGSVEPVANDFPWGTDSRDKVSRYYNAEGELVFESGLSEKELNDNNKEFYGASFYWIMDMNKSLWERCISIGSKKGREFAGSHGDGMLGGYFGNATNEDWPDSKTSDSGVGYRGGGTYSSGLVGSPSGRVGERSFAGWGECPKDIAYGFRAVRTGQ